MGNVDINLDPTTTKYMIRANINADGVVEKPDVVGAIFGQTEGLLGNELDLRDLQKSGRIGRIEVDVKSQKGKTSGSITLPSSMDKVETAIIAAAVESIDRVGPCKADIKVSAIEDVRVVKRKQVISRAKALLVGLVDSAKDESDDLTEEVRAAVRTEELISYGQERLPAGPHILKSDAVIVVEGRNDVINLLKHGIKNAIAVEGTSVPKSIQDLTKDKITTVFVDGDRGGELILKELFQTCEIDFVARAPKGREVEELMQKNIMKSLRNKIPAEQYLDIAGLGDLRPEQPRSAERQERAQAATRAEREALDRIESRAAGQYVEEPALAPPQGRGPQAGAPGARPEMPRREERRDERRDERDREGGRGRRGRRGRGRDRDRREEREPRMPMGGPREERGPSPAAAMEDEEEFEEVEVVGAPGGGVAGREEQYLGLLNDLGGKLQAMFLDQEGGTIGAPIPVRDLADTLRKAEEPRLKAVVFDGVITQRLLDIASEKGINTLIGVKTGNITKRPGNVEVLTRADLERA